MKNKHQKISILIPAYNSAKTIRPTIESALAQNYDRKEIIVVDDCSEDDTVKIAKEFPGVKVYVNPANFGIGVNLANCMNYATAAYVVYLCADDMFADENVVADIVNIFDQSPKLGIINRWYYQFLNGIPGPVVEVRHPNLFISACNPSGIALRKKKVWGTNKIFLEMPYIVLQFLEAGWEWTTMEYDTIAVRLHPGGNTGTLSSYYNESPTKVWADFLGPDFKDHLILIQLKNRAPHMVWDEIKTILKINPENKKDKFFWFCACVALLCPTWLLRHLCDFYRHRINRLDCKIVKRPNPGEKNNGQNENPYHRRVWFHRTPLRGTHTKKH